MTALFLWSIIGSSSPETTTQVPSELMPQMDRPANGRELNGTVRGGGWCRWSWVLYFYSICKKILGLAFCHFVWLSEGGLPLAGRVVILCGFGSIAIVSTFGWRGTWNSENTRWLIDKQNVHVRGMNPVWLWTCFTHLQDRSLLPLSRFRHGGQSLQVRDAAPGWTTPAWIPYSNNKKGKKKLA